jgi:hypothetical protein
VLYVWPRWQAALSVCDPEAVTMLVSVQQWVDSAVAADLDGIYVAIKVAEGLQRVVASLRGTLAAFDSMAEASRRFNKEGASTFGQLAKTQRERGFITPFPTGPYPVIEGKALNLIVGGYIRPLQLTHPAVVEVAQEGPKPSMRGTDVSVRGGGAGWMPTARRGGSSVMGRRDRDGGALFRWLSDWCAANGRDTTGKCLGCVFLGRGDRARHSLADCFNWEQAQREAIADGFVPGREADLGRGAEFGRGTNSAVYGGSVRSSWGTQGRGYASRSRMSNGGHDQDAKEHFPRDGRWEHADRSRSAGALGGSRSTYGSAARR